MTEIFQDESGHDEVLIVNENDDGDEEAVSVGTTTTQLIEDNATTPLTTPKIKLITKNLKLSNLTTTPMPTAALVVLI